MYGVLWSLSLSNGFVLGLPPRGCFWIESKWPWNMLRLTPCRHPCRLLHPSCIHILCWSLKRSVKLTHTGPAFSTDESAWSVLVAGSQSRVWSRPNVWVGSPSMCEHGDVERPLIYLKQAHSILWSCICIQDWKVASLHDADADPCKIATHLASLNLNGIIYNYPVNP